MRLLNTMLLLGMLGSTEPASALDPVNGLTAAATANTVTLRWQPVLDATEYLILRNGVQIGMTVATVYIDANLPPSTGYVYAVEAVQLNVSLSTVNAATGKLTAGSSAIVLGVP